ncbi:MAG: ComF family protein [Clostridia bacterium]|nr:ComF family protein [Clostridia bacterium]
MNAIARTLLTALFPRRCAYCGVLIDKNALGCNSCMASLPRMAFPTCPHCGRSKSLCRCRGRMRAYDRCVAAMRYEGGVSYAVLKLKKKPLADVVEIMSVEMAARFRVEQECEADVVCGIPMTGRERRARGYNQSELLAKEVAKRLSLPYRPLLKKIYETKPQKALSGADRNGNLLGAFDVTESVAGRHILLVDDVITTGATMNECAKMLKIYGAETVTALTFAATVPHDQPTAE